jgi:hypothetical protein
MGADPTGREMLMYTSELKRPMSEPLQEKEAGPNTFKSVLA